MISIRKSGTYKLIETKRHTKILYLGPVAYAWIEPTRIGVILVSISEIGGSVGMDISLLLLLLSLKKNSGNCALRHIKAFL